MSTLPQRPLGPRELLELDLRHKYLIQRVPDEVAIKVFRKAWEEGHSAGHHEVEFHYDELSEIANAAFKAGQDVEARFRASRSCQRGVHHSPDVEHECRPTVPNKHGFVCLDFDEDGSCIHSDHMQAAGL